MLIKKIHVRAIPEFERDLVRFCGKIISKSTCIKLILPNRAHPVKMLPQQLFTVRTQFRTSLNKQPVNRSAVRHRTPKLGLRSPFSVANFASFQVRSEKRKW